MLTIDYKQLLKNHICLEKYWKDDRYHFIDTESIILLNKCILEDYFNITVPDELIDYKNLFPRVPGRFSYVEFINDILLKPYTETYCKDKSTFSMLDIGTGAYSIYSLLFSRQLDKEQLFKDIQIIATDIDQDSVQNAQKIIKSNKLQDKITVVKTDAKSHFFSALEGQANETMITMCNPPFYSSYEQLQNLTDMKINSKTLIPLAGTNNELITEGGELSFLIKMVQDSISMKKFKDTKILWFTSLVSRYSTLCPLIQYMKHDLGILDCYVQDATMGHTTRWILCWNLQNWKLKLRKVTKNLQKLQSYHTVLKVSNSVVNKSLVDIEQLLLKTTSNRLIINLLDHHHLSIITEVGDCWSRSFRRRNTTVSNSSDSHLTSVPHYFILEVISEGEVQLVWHRGQNYQLFQSLLGLINRLYLL